MPKLIFEKLESGLYNPSEMFALIYPIKQNYLKNRERFLGVGKIYENEFAYATSLQLNVLPVIKNGLAKYANLYEVMDASFDSQGSPPGIRIRFTNPMHQDKAHLQERLTRVVQAHNKKYCITNNKHVTFKEQQIDQPLQQKQQKTNSVRSLRKS